MIFSAQSVQAEPAERIFENPPLLELHKQDIPKTKPDGQVEFDLSVKYTSGEIYNPTTNHDDKVNLRSYVGTGTSTETPYVGPTIEVKPGNTVRINLKNELPPNFSLRCQDLREPGNENQPNCNNHNRTNLHSHGLWISPTGNSDNVLSVLDPTVTFQYEYNIPLDHPAGTFWYHPHLHGSTALQVASGMSGALIVRGDRLPSKSANGDIDTLLKKADIKEQILLFQQIQYACLDENNNVKWNCQPEETGEIESYKGLFSPRSWIDSKRYTSINGQVLPTFTAEPGKIERWRMIHAGVRNTINLEFRKLKDNAPTLKDYLQDKTADNTTDSYKKKYCPSTNETLPYHIIADDGLTRSAAWETKLTTLQPGYRNDALVVFPQAGGYCVVDAQAPASESVTREEEKSQLLGFVNVIDPNAGVNNTSKLPVFYIEDKDIHKYLTNKLVAAARDLSIPSMEEKIVNDLKNGLKLTAFMPHLDVQDSEVNGYQELAFSIDNRGFLVSNDIGNDPKLEPYDHKRIDRTLTLGKVEEWTLQSNVAGHPFHIHVNPFQIVKILDPQGNDVSLPDAKDGVEGKIDPEYRGLKGVWKDTIWVKGPKSKTERYTIVIRTRYERYIGDFVLHCHILDHEDQGMMQNVSIVIPKAVSAKTASHS
ncbi:multicopper oxidase family protein [Dolichospermum sp. UHCC 0259]|nr:multicopper oxidase family protein [Dolichospermum sp. UHCC 0259]